VFETTTISTRIEGRSGLSPTPAAAARDRDPNSTRWQPHPIQPKLDNHGSIERWNDAPPFKQIERRSVIESDSDKTSGFSAPNSSVEKRLGISDELAGARQKWVV